MSPRALFPRVRVATVRLTPARPQLLQRDPTQRLGCGKDDGDEIIRHPFFQGIDFEKLLHKVYQPPFKPKVVRWRRAPSPCRGPA